MLKKIVVLVIIIILFLIFYLKFSKIDKVTEKKINQDITSFNSNVLENMEYIARDSKGNQYIIRAVSGEIDLNNNEIIFLKDVKALIKLINSNEIRIKSDFGYPF